ARLAWGCKRLHVAPIDRDLASGADRDTRSAGGGHAVDLGLDLRLDLGCRQRCRLDALQLTAGNTDLAAQAQDCVADALALVRPGTASGHCGGLMSLAPLNSSPTKLLILEITCSVFARTELRFERSRSSLSRSARTRANSASRRVCSVPSALWSRSCASWLARSSFVRMA